MPISYYRERARNVLAGKWGNAIWVALVAAFFGALLMGSNISLSFEMDESIMQYIPDAVLAYLAIAAGIGSILGIMQFILGGVIRLGYCKYLLNLEDGREGNVKDLFSQMDGFGDGFVLSLLTGLYTALWTMLFIIPGIIATFKYAMAPFILLENPRMRPNEAITASKNLMDGHKGELFLLNLSFIGWEILCVLSLGIGYLWLNPYMNASCAAFYRSLRPRMEYPPVDQNWGMNNPRTDFTAETTE